MGSYHPTSSAEVAGRQRPSFRRNSLCTYSRETRRAGRRDIPQVAQGVRLFFKEGKESTVVGYIFRLHGRNNKKHNDAHKKRTEHYFEAKK